MEPCYEANTPHKEVFCQLHLSIGPFHARISNANLQIEAHCLPSDATPVVLLGVAAIYTNRWVCFKSTFCNTSQKQATLYVIAAIQLPGHWLLTFACLGAGLELLHHSA
jgi:hypothetical protein